LQLPGLIDHARDFPAARVFLFHRERRPRLRSLLERD
jgi:hypothetical protein